MLGIYTEHSSELEQGAPLLSLDPPA